MTLDQKLREIMGARRGFILIVDDRCDVEMPHHMMDDVYYEHCSNEEECEAFAHSRGIGLTLLDASHRDIQDPKHSFRAGSIYRQLKGLNGDPSLVIVASNLNGQMPQLQDAARSIATARILDELLPQAEIIYALPDMATESANAAFDKMLNLLMSFPPGTARKRVDLNTYPTMMHLLAHRLTGRFIGRAYSRNKRAEQHDYKNKMWKENFLPYIDVSLRAGSLQTEMEYHFLVLSDREIENLGQEKRHVAAKEKIRVESNIYALDDLDIAKCAAIFIDNCWDEGRHRTCLGDGIHTLRRISKQLREKGVNIPVIYQSGHWMDDFLPEERAEIEGLGAVLAPKDVFPKVCRRELSEKEIEMGRALGRHERVAKYAARVYDFGRREALGRENMFVVCSRMAFGEPVPDKEKDEIYAKLNLERNVVNHKMYVLSLFHSDMKEEVGNDRLQATSRDFFSFGEVMASAPHYAGQLEPIRQLYINILDKHRQMKPRVLTHNDAKDDNWFQDILLGETPDGAEDGRWMRNIVLGDFGSVQPGMEYKDIAKAVMDKALDRKFVDDAIDAYVAIRQEHDKEFMPEAGFRQNVYEMIVTESMRTVHYKAGQKELADKLVNVALMYAGILKEEYAEYGGIS